VKCWEYGMENLFDLLIYKLYFWCAGTWLLLASLGFLIYGIKIHWTISRIIHDYEKQVRMLFKLTGVIAICFVCCLIRVIALAFLYVADFSNEMEIIFSDQYYFVWYLISYFLPYYGLLATMLYVTRKADHQQANQMGAPALENADPSPSPSSASLENPLLSTDSTDDDPLSEKRKKQLVNQGVISSVSNIQEYTPASTSSTPPLSSYSSQKFKNGNKNTHPNKYHVIQPSSLSENDVSLSPDARMLMGSSLVGSQNDDVFTEI